MSTVRVDQNSRRAFTLLEVTLAVVILGMMALAIYRFVSANLVAMQASAALNEDNAQYAGLANLLAEELQDLPPGQGTLSGEPFKFEARSRDEMTWICSAGPGLLTRYASGEYSVTLRLRPMPKGNRMQLGIVRESQDDGDSSGENQSWIPLIANLNSIEIRYFDSRLNAWVDRWTDNTALPCLVRLTIDRASSTVPWEAVLPLRRTPL